MPTPVVYKAFKKLPGGKLQSVGDGTNAVVALPPTPPKGGDSAVRIENIGEVFVPRDYPWSTGPHFSTDPIACLNQIPKEVGEQYVIARINLLPGFRSKEGGMCESPWGNDVALTRVKILHLSKIMTTRHFTIETVLDSVTEEWDECDIKVKCAFKGGLPHDPSPGVAALVKSDGFVRTFTHYQEGIIHRDDGPAYREEFGSGGIEKWFKRGMVHRHYLDGPAERSVNHAGVLVAERYVQDGVEHRPS